MTHWFHVWCAAYRRPEAFLEAVNAGSGSLPEGMGDLAMMKREAELGLAHHRVPRVNAAERASTGRASCRQCRTPIPKDAWRISLLYYEDGRFQPSGFVHLGCANTYFETAAILPRVRHFSPALTDADITELETALACPPQA